jgi:hypothetical protein
VSNPIRATAVVKKTREQLIEELAMRVCKVTGTHSFDVGDRIICQVANAQVGRSQRIRLTT